MKDKRLILKISSIIEYIYILLMFIYYILNGKSLDEFIGNVFLLVISLCFAILMYKLSNKEIKELRNNKIMLTIVSVWLLFDFLLPGILGFYFIRTLSDKNIYRLPVINDKKISINDKIKSVALLTLFMSLMYVLPKFNFFSKVPDFLIYGVIFISVLCINYRELKKEFSIFVKNVKIYIPYIIKNYFKMLGFMLIVAVPIVLINNGNSSNNQEAINIMFKETPFFTFVLTCFYAPFVEETLFRLNLSKLINNKKLFIILSGFIFGLLHIIGQASDIKEYIYIFQYSALGIYLAKTYKETNNIYVTICMHFIQNFLAATLILLLF